MICIFWYYVCDISWKQWKSCKDDSFGFLDEFGEFFDVGSIVKQQIWSEGAENVDVSFDFEFDVSIEFLTK